MKPTCGSGSILKPLLPSTSFIMPPKRNSAYLRALADDATAGWLQTPVASRTDVGLPGDYLSAFMKHHDMPVTRQQVNYMNGLRLWQSKSDKVPDDQRNVSTVFPGGIEALARAFDHGFAAPVAAQEKLLAFLRSLPSDRYGNAVVQLEAHYSLCRAFRIGERELGSPPSYLDLFKDDRVPKKWRTDCTFQSVLINTNELLRAWPGLMSVTWNPMNAARDALSAWNACCGDVESLHSNIDQEGPVLIV
jgi:hypothetical protein